MDVEYPEQRQDADRQEHFRLRSERVISSYLRDHADSRLQKRVQDRALSLDDAHEIMGEANLDEKTGVPNAKFLEYILNDELAQSRETEKPVCVLLLDIDDFKKINDELGHTGADVILREVAQAIQASIRTSDALTPYASDQSVSRWGGEEFVAILPGADTDQAYRVADRIRRKIAEELANRRPGGNPVTVTVGLAEYDRTKHGDARLDEQWKKEKQKLSWQRFIEEADRAVMEGKRVEKNKVYPEAEVA